MTVLTRPWIDASNHCESQWIILHTKDKYPKHLVFQLNEELFLTPIPKWILNMLFFWCIRLLYPFITQLFERMCGTVTQGITTIWNSYPCSGLISGVQVPSCSIYQHRICSMPPQHKHGCSNYRRNLLYSS